MNNKKCIVYIAPEIPGLSATFVYNEIIALEKKGYHILPVSIHLPTNLAIDKELLTDRTHYLYQDGFVVFLISFLKILFIEPKSLVKVLSWFTHDFLEVGLFRKDAWKLFFHLLAACRLVKILGNKRCEHIHIHFSDVPTQIGMYVSAITGIPFSVTSHANDIFEHGRLLVIKAKRANCFATISEYNRDYLISQGVPAEKVALVRCAVNFEKIDEKGLIKDKQYYRIGSLGRLVEKKGMSILIHAIRLVLDKRYNIELIIAGDGPDRENLKMLANKLGIQKSVNFIGAIPNNNVSTWLNGLDIFVLACKKDSRGDMDGIPVALMEAMSQGVPVISTRISGIPELIKHKDTGLLAEPDDPVNLADLIIELINNPVLSNKLSEKGLEYVFSEFGEKTNIERLEHCFQK